MGSCACVRAGVTATGTMGTTAPQHFLNLRPLPHGQGSLRAGAARCSGTDTDSRGDAAAATMRILTRRKAAHDEHLRHRRALGPHPDRPQGQQDAGRAPCPRSRCEPFRDRSPHRALFAVSLAARALRGTHVRSRRRAAPTGARIRRHLRRTRAAAPLLPHRRTVRFGDRDRVGDDLLPDLGTIHRGRHGRRPRANPEFRDLQSRRLDLGLFRTTPRRSCHGRERQADGVRDARGDRPRARRGVDRAAPASPAPAPQNSRRRGARHDAALA